MFSLLLSHNLLLWQMAVLIYISWQLINIKFLIIHEIIVHWLR